MRLFICIGSLVLLSLSVYGQKFKFEYLIKDSTYIEGRIIKHNDSTVQFQKNKRARIISYSISELKEFGDEGKVYKPLLINGKVKFLTKLSSGDVNLYQYKNEYVFEKDSIYFKLTKENYRSILPVSIDCSGDKNLTKLDYTENSLKYFIDSYNLKKCNSNNLPHFKLGSYIGTGQFKFNSTYDESIEFSEHVTPLIFGLFTDIPFYNLPVNLYLTAELNWFNTETLFVLRNGNSTKHFAANFSVINSQVGAKWVILNKKPKLFIKSNVMSSYVQFKSPTGYIETYSSGDITNIFNTKLRDANGLLLGLNSGLGVEIPIRKRKVLHAEIKYYKTFNGNFSPFTLNYSGLTFSVGLSI